MRNGAFILCVIFTLRLVSHEGGSFGENHYRFIVEHLPKLLEGNSGKVLLICSYYLTHQRLSKQYPLIEFDAFSFQSKNSWDETIKKRNLNGVFDCVIAMHVLEREPFREKVLQMISDLLKPGGKILIYLDPQEEEEAFDQKIEQYVRRSRWHERIPIIPSLSIPEYQNIIESAGLCILDQSPAQYQVYYAHSFDAFLSLGDFVCSRWPVPRTTHDEELFVGEIRGRLKKQHEIIEIPGSPSDFNSWIEDKLPTYYFIIQKQNY